MLCNYIFYIKSGIPDTILMDTYINHAKGKLGCLVKNSSKIKILIHSRIGNNYTNLATVISRETRFTKSAVIQPIHDCLILV